MNFKLLGFLIFSSLTCYSCSKESSESPINPNDPNVPNDTVSVNVGKYFLGFDMQHPPFRNILFDTVRNNIYIFENVNLNGTAQYGGRLICYNYENEEIKAEGQNPDFLNGNLIAANEYLGKFEIYVGVDKNVYIYDGESLMLKDSINVLDFAEDAKISSLGCGEPGILYIGLCSKGIHAVNRATKQSISKNDVGCRAIRTSKNSIANTTQVFGVDINTSNPSFKLMNFSLNGNYIDYKILFYPNNSYPSIDIDLFKSNEGTDYLLNHSDGNFFSKTDLSYLGTLDGKYNDYVVSRNGDVIYAVTKNKTVEIIEYPSFNKRKVIDLKYTADHCFVDGNQLILLYYKRIQTFVKTEIYFAKIDL